MGIVCVHACVYSCYTLHACFISELFYQLIEPSGRGSGTDMLLFVKTSGDISHRVGNLGQTCCCLFKHPVISAIG